MVVCRDSLCDSRGGSIWMRHGGVKEKSEKILGFRCDGSDTTYNVELYILLE